MGYGVYVTEGGGDGVGPVTTTEEGGLGGRWRRRRKDWSKRKGGVEGRGREGLADERDGGVVVQVGKRGEGEKNR